eukprot:358281-Chlamydomonas_euryale.AAC.10
MIWKRSAEGRAGAGLTWTGLKIASRPVQHIWWVGCMGRCNEACDICCLWDMSMAWRHACGKTLMAGPRQRCLVPGPGSGPW